MGHRRGRRRGGAGGLLLSSHHQRAVQQAENASQTPDAYASQLAISNLQMSEAANFAGSKVTYVDGLITNKGDKTVTGINVVVTFNNDIGEPPQKTPMPLTLIRTREPYVDIEPVSAEPLKPGDTRTNFVSSSTMFRRRGISNIRPIQPIACADPLTVSGAVFSRTGCHNLIARRL